MGANSHVASNSEGLDHILRTCCPSSNDQKSANLVDTDFSFNGQMDREQGRGCRVISFPVPSEQ